MSDHQVPNKNHTKLCNCDQDHCAYIMITNVGPSMIYDYPRIITEESCSLYKLTDKRYNDEKSAGEYISIEIYKRV